MAHGLRRLRFECTRCGDCCRRFRVPLTHTDLRRLTLATSRSAATLVDWLSPDEVDMTGEPETFVALPEGRRLMALAFRDGGCALLGGDACSVHPSRPLSCRLYPFDVSLGSRGGIRRLRFLDTTGCPYTLTGVHRQRDVAELAARERKERSEYAELVQRFNRLQLRRKRLGKALLLAEHFFGRLLSEAVSAATDTTRTKRRGLPLLAP